MELIKDLNNQALNPNYLFCITIKHMSDLVVYNLAGNDIFKWGAMNAYRMNVNIPIDPMQSANVNFPIIIQDQIPDLVETHQFDRQIDILQSGMFSFKTHIAIQLPPGAHVESGTSFLLAVNQNTVEKIIDNVQQITPTTISESPASIITLSLSWTGYLNKGDYAFTELINQSSFGITVIAASSFLTIARLY